MPEAGGCGVHVPLVGVSLFQVVTFGDWGVQLPDEGVCAIHVAGSGEIGCQLNVSDAVNVIVALPDIAPGAAGDANVPLAVN